MGMRKNSWQEQLPRSLAVPVPAGVSGARAKLHRGARPMLRRDRSHQEWIPVTQKRTKTTRKVKKSSQKSKLKLPSTAWSCHLGERCPCHMGVQGRSSQDVTWGCHLAHKPQISLRMVPSSSLGPTPVSLGAQECCSSQAWRKKLSPPKVTRFEAGPRLPHSRAPCEMEQTSGASQSLPAAPVT